MRRFLFMALSTAFIFFLSGGINSAFAMKFLSNKNKRDVVVLRPYIKGHLHGRTSDINLGEAILTDSKFL